MRTIKYKILSFLFLGLVLFSCKDSFLDTKPLATVSEESFYTSMEAADMATTVCYSLFDMEKLWDLSIVMTLGSISSDESEAAAAGKGDVPEFQAIDQLRHTASTPNTFSMTYGYLLRTIGYCNVALVKMNPYDPGNLIKTTDPDYDIEIIKKHMGEAYFLRAFNFFTLTQVFGGVPKVDHVLQPSEYNMARSSIKEIYDLIKSDCDSAIKYLPEKSILDNIDEPGRASKGASKALKAKVYLYESSYAKNYPGDARFEGLAQKWDSVNIWAEQVINSGEYELIGSDGARFESWRDPVNGVGGYYYIFSPRANNSMEEVFSIQSRQDGLGWFVSRGTALIRWCAPKYINKSTVVTGDGEQFGWGWWSPTDFLVSEFEDGDIRYKATVLEATDSIYVPLGTGAMWGRPNFNILERGTGCHRGQRKYECSPDEFWNRTGSWKEGPTNVKMIRIADVYLWNAEAYIEVGNNTKALENINKVRTRARMSGDGLNPVDLNGTLTRDNIIHERLVELSCEGHRYFDLVRWNLGVQYLNHRLSNDDQIQYVSGKHEFFPLPETEISLSKGVLKQNYGY